jgi:hypothetical protein
MKSKRENNIKIRCGPYKWDMCLFFPAMDQGSQYGNYDHKEAYILFLIRHFLPPDKLRTHLLFIFFTTYSFVIGLLELGFLDLLKN